MNQILLSTLPHPNLSGQTSLFSFPDGFDWLKNLEAREIAAFLNELLDAIRVSQNSDDWLGVKQVIEAWTETSLLSQDNVLMDRVRHIRENPEPGLAYEVVREKLGI